jgi:hypothetical protein
MTGMWRRQAFKFELLPRGRQQRDMHRFAGACRYVFNQALALQRANYEGGGKFIGYVAMAKRLTEWRNGSETPWLGDTAGGSAPAARRHERRGDTTGQFEDRMTVMYGQPGQPGIPQAGARQPL